MDFVLLPMRALQLIVILIGMLIGAFWLRKSNVLCGAVAGGVAASILAWALLAFMPAKLTTNTKQYNSAQTSAAYARHQEMPERVVVEVKTFEQLQAEEASRSLIENQKLKEDLQ